MVSSSGLRVGVAVASALMGVLHFVRVTAVLFGVMVFLIAMPMIGMGVGGVVAGEFGAVSGFFIAGGVGVGVVSKVPLATLIGEDE